jgi:hypothetical protein
MRDITSCSWFEHGEVQLIGYEAPHKNCIITITIIIIIIISGSRIIIKDLGGLT